MFVRRKKSDTVYLKRNCRTPGISGDDGAVGGEREERVNRRGGRSDIYVVNREALICTFVIKRSPFLTDGAQRAKIENVFLRCCTARPRKSTCVSVPFPPCTKIMPLPSTSSLHVYFSRGAEVK